MSTSLLSRLDSLAHWRRLLDRAVEQLAAGMESNGLLDAQGVIRTQVYGDFSAEALGEPIRRLLRGMLISDTHTAADFIDRVRIFCSVYDPTTGKYKADYTLILQIAGGVTFFVAMLGFGVGEWWSQRKARRRLRRPSPTRANPAATAACCASWTPDWLKVPCPRTSA